MFALSQYVGFGGGSGASSQNFLQILTELGFTTNLKAVIDPADIASYSGSGQNFNDLNGTDHLYRGSSSGSDSTDPTFNGVAGALTSSEYFSGDGSDFFRWQSQPSWVQSWHEDNAIFTAVFTVYQAAGAGGRFDLFGTNGGSGANRGLYIQADTGGGLATRPVLSVKNGSGGTPLEITASSVALPSGWSLLAFGVNEATGASGAYIYAGGASQTFTSTYSSPGSGASSHTAEIFALGNGNSNHTSGCRLGPCAFWSGTMLTTANIASIRSALSTARFSGALG